MNKRKIISWIPIFYYRVVFQKILVENNFVLHQTTKQLYLTPNDFSEF